MYPRRKKTGVIIQKTNREYSNKIEETEESKKIKEGAYIMYNKRNRV